MSFEQPIGRFGTGGPTRRRLQLALKRFLDILLSLVVLLLSWPVLLLIAVLVKLSSPGPVFFVQARAGLGQKPFPMLKFRTMAEASSKQQATVWTAAEEARITPLGRFLRDYGLDELPQLLNILRGDMSIVGPRPPLPVQVESYTERQRKMFQMRPGVLSLAAVEGRRALPVERRIELHVRYVEAWSLGLDFRILWRALFVVLGRQDASETRTEPGSRPEHQEIV
jgi:sugar transferase EpsL